MKQIDFTINNCYECPYLLVISIDNMLLGALFSCRKTNKDLNNNIMDSIADICPLQDAKNENIKSIDKDFYNK